MTADPQVPGSLSGGGLVLNYKGRLKGSSCRDGEPSVTLAREPTRLPTTAQHGTITVVAMQQTAADVNVIDGQAQSTDTPPWKVSSPVGLPPIGNSCCVRAQLGTMQEGALLSTGCSPH